VVIDARNLEKRIEARLAILAILDFGEVDGVVELAHRPTKLNAILVGGMRQIRDKQGCGQQQSNDRGKPAYDSWRHRAIPNVV
jgi:hypothetical protein